MSCNECKYSKKEEDGSLFCRRFPPQFAGWSPEKDIRWFGFPGVQPGMWCGEWNSKQ